MPCTMPTSYTQLFYHIVWATRKRAPLLAPDVLKLVLLALGEKSSEVGGKLHAANGVDDHVHLAVRLPATVTVATYVEAVKGYASWRVNHSPETAEHLYWQEGYGALTFRKTELSVVVRYIQRQQEHHSRGDCWAEFEWTDDRE